MNAKEARAIFNDAIATETDPDKLATKELLREYFTNEAFRQRFHDFSAECHGVKGS